MKYSKTGILGLKSPRFRMSPCMEIVHKDPKNTIHEHVYYVTVMPHVILWRYMGTIYPGAFEPVTPLSMSIP